MAELLVDGGGLVLHLSATEKVGAVHGDRGTVLMGACGAGRGHARAAASTAV